MLLREQKVMVCRYDFCTGNKSIILIVLSQILAMASKVKVLQFLSYNIVLVYQVKINYQKTTTIVEMQLSPR